MMKRKRLSRKFELSPLKAAAILVIAVLLLAGTSFVVRNGNRIVDSGTGKPITDNDFFGDRAYRDVRGIPFVFLKRSIGDGECDVQDLRDGLCDPGNGNEPHQLKYLPLVADLVFWFLTAWLFIEIFRRYVSVKR